MLGFDEHLDNYGDPGPNTEGKAMPDDLGNPTHAEREHENAQRIARAKAHADWVRLGMSQGGSFENATPAIAHALAGLLEIAIVRADVRSYEPPF